ncbi:MAG: hypothetical protein J2P30_25480, partial [Actinobacteria bacterium]|nr:hypothetical protein [Actinomycetota bacterium]
MAAGAHTPASSHAADAPAYDLRHSGITWRLDSGIPATEIAAGAGHSVEMLMRVRGVLESCDITECP